MRSERARFPRQCRLVRGDDIHRVRAEGARDRTPWFEIRRIPSSLSHPRVAVVVPRFGETAVARNRVKRRLRELVRRELLPVLSPQDVVVRATPMAYRVPFETLRRGMNTVVSRLSAHT